MAAFWSTASSPPRPRTIGLRGGALVGGTMNFLTGQVIGRQNGHAAVALPGGGTCEVPAARIAGREHDICLAIRPERIILHPA